VRIAVTTNVLAVLFAFDVLLVAVVVCNRVGADSFKPVKLTCHFANVYLLHVIYSFAVG
jgi:hypothetical protein